MVHSFYFFQKFKSEFLFNHAELKLKVFCGVGPPFASSLLNCSISVRLDG